MSSAGEENCEPMPPVVTGKASAATIIEFKRPFDEKRAQEYQRAAAERRERLARSRAEKNDRERKAEERREELKAAKAEEAHKHLLHVESVRKAAKAARDAVENATAKPELLPQFAEQVRPKLFKLGARLLNDVALKAALNGLIAAITPLPPRGSRRGAGNADDASSASSASSGGFDHSSPSLSGIAAKEANVEPLLLPSAPEGSFDASPVSGFFSFENLTGLLQRPDVNNTAKELSLRLLSVADVMDRLNLLKPLAAPLYGDAAAEDGAAATTAAAAVNAMLRPQVARSHRAMLASLLFAFHPHEVLQTESHAAAPSATAAAESSARREDEEEAKRKKAANDAALVEASRRLLASLHVLQKALSTSGPSTATSCPQPLERYERATDALLTEDGDRLFRGLVEAFASLPASAVTATPPRSTSDAAPAPTTSSASSLPADPKQVSAALLALVSFLRVWCDFADCFQVWKAGDGARVAQSLTLTYRVVLSKLQQYEEEASKEMGKADAGLEELREGTKKQLESMHRQVASLLGHAAAAVWIKEQTAAVMTPHSSSSSFSATGSSFPGTPPFGPRLSLSSSAHSASSPLMTGLALASFPVAGSPGSSSPVIRSPERAAQRTLASAGLRAHIHKMRNSPTLSPLASPKLSAATAGGTATASPSGARSSGGAGAGGVKLREDGSVAISDDESNGAIKIFLLGGNSAPGSPQAAGAGVGARGGRGAVGSSGEEEGESLRLPPPADGSPFTPRRRAAAAAAAAASSGAPMSPLHKSLPPPSASDTDGGEDDGSGKGKGGVSFSISPPPKVSRTANFQVDTTATAAVPSGTAPAPVPGPSSVASVGGFARGFLLGRSPHHRTTEAAPPATTATAAAAAGSSTATGSGGSPSRSALQAAASPGGTAAPTSATPPASMLRPDGGATVPSPRTAAGGAPGESASVPPLFSALGRFSNPAIVHELMLDASFGLKTPDLPDDLAIGLRPGGVGATRSRSGSIASRGSGSLRSFGAGAIGSGDQESKVGPVTLALLSMDRLDVAVAIRELCLLCHPPPVQTPAEGLVGEAEAGAASPLPPTPAVPPQSLLPYRGGARIDPRNPEASLKRSPAFWAAMLSGSIEEERYLEAGGIVIAREEDVSPASAAASAGAAEKEKPFADAVITCLQAGLAVLSETIPVENDASTSAQLARAVSSSLDLALYHGLLAKRLIKAEDWVQILSHFVDLVKGLEAKARNQESDAWFMTAGELVAHIYQAHHQQNHQHRSETTTTDSATATAMAPLKAELLQSLVLTLLPRLLAWVHFKAEQMRIDGANAHLMLLRPTLIANNKGNEYLRSHFQAAVQRGEISVETANKWLSSAFVSSVKKAAAGVPIDAPTKQAIGFILTTHPQPIVAATVVEGCLQLIQESQPLLDLARASTPASAPAEGGGAAASPPSTATVFPSTLLFDAARLTALQNTLQRLVLVPTLAANVQQFVATAPAASGMASDGGSGFKGMPGSALDPCSSFAELQRRCHAWLSDEETIRMPELEGGLVAGANDLLIAAGKQPLGADDKEEDDETTAKGRLVKAVRAAVSASHPVFVLMRGRVSQLLRARLVARLVDDSAAARVLAAASANIGSAAASSWLNAMFVREAALPPQVRASVLLPSAAKGMTAAGAGKERDGNEEEAKEDEEAGLSGPNEDAVAVVDVLERVVRLSLGVHEGLYRSIIKEASLTLDS